MQLYFSCISLISNLSPRSSRRGKMWSQSIGPFIWRPSHHGRGGGWKPQALTSLPLGILWVSFTPSLQPMAPWGWGVFVNKSKRWLLESPSSHFLLARSHHLPGSSKEAEQPWAAFTDSGYLGFLLPPRKSRLQAPRCKASDIVIPPTPVMSSSHSCPRLLSPLALTFHTSPKC